MHIYLCTLTFQENLFYATREVGRLYETGRYLHNYALTYALELAVSPYFNSLQSPCYAQDLRPLNDRGIYVTPARGVQIAFALNTFKYASNQYHVEMKPGRTNTPTFGRAKEIAAESVFQFAILSAKEALALPRWLRMGLWRSKAELQYELIEATKTDTSLNQATLPLNPLDLDKRLATFDLISMPPSSLVDNVLLESEWWTAVTSQGEIRLPFSLNYRFPEGTS
ncbi:MAG: type I-D CRISPR-associated protein Cas5/Csc1 [Anaerolineales bacterium]|nr:type I-D CRISPR-associated protein Cas5/Csc1 [Anaerolineales bacterium]